MQVLPQCQNLQQPLLRTCAEDLLQHEHAHKHIETSRIKRLVKVFPSGERLSFTTTPPAYATSCLHSCMSLRFYPNLLFQIVSFTVKSLEVLDMQQTFHQHVSFVLIASLFLFLNTEMLSSDSCSRQCLHQRGCYQRNL